MPYVPNAIEIHPCVVVGRDAEGKEVMQTCDEGDPETACWGLYFHADKTGIIHVKDFDTKEEAERGAKLLRLFMDAMGYRHI